MLRTIVRFSLRFPWLPLLAAAALAIAGVLALFHADYDVFPEFAAPIVAVYTAVPGLGPRDIESLVSTPIEDAINGAPGLQSLRSQSIAGVSVVTALFHGGTDLYRDRQFVAERLAAAARFLPARARPVLEPSESAAGNVLDIGLTSNRLSLMQLTEFARAVIRPALLAVPGVAAVPIFGARPLEWQIRVDPAALLAAHIGLNQVIAAAASASAVRGAGLLDTAEQRFLLQTHGQAGDLSALGESVIERRAGAPLRLADVARLLAASAPPESAALIGTKPGLLLVVSSLYGSNTLAVVEGLDEALHRLNPALAREGIKPDTKALRPTSFIIEALHDLRNSLLIGSGLILFVLIFALRNGRVAAISFVTIPLSLLLAVLVLYAFGLSLNTLSLGGLAIALGSVVDDAIIDIENIRRRLIENAGKEEPQPRLKVILGASLEVRTAIVFATIAIALVFLPVLALGGVAGRLFAPLAIAFIAAIFASLALALTLTPSLASLLLGAGAIAAKDPRFVTLARSLHRRALKRLSRFGNGALFVLAAAGAGAILSLAFLPRSFLPSFHENDVIAHFLAPPGTSLTQTQGLAKRLVATLEKMPEVGHVVVHIGHAEQGHGLGDVNRAEIDITLSARGNRDSAASKKAIEAALGALPGTRFWANSFLTERIHEVLSGTTAPIVVHVLGRHLKALDADARRVAALLRRVPGAEAITIAAPAATPSISVRLRRAALLRYELQPRSVLDAVQAGFAGRQVGRVYRGGTSWPITVLLPPSAHPDPADIGRLPVLDGKGRIVPLEALARLRIHRGRSMILHRNAQRVQNVVAEVHGSAAAFLGRARKALRGLSLSPGTYLAFGGTAKAAGGAQKTLFLYGGGAFLLIMALLAAGLGGARPAILLAANLPFALIGGIAAIWIARLPLDLGAGVGLVTVFGITLRNGLMLFSHYRHLLAREGASWTGETAERGAVERVVPILLTATVTALGLLPLAAGAGLAGQEIEGPMAIVILGGLLSSTPLTLLVLPGLAARFLRREHLERAEAEV